jgi:anti-sigma regulatory factor (Ser/Thr protein kinase)
VRTHLDLATARGTSGRQRQLTSLLVRSGDALSASIDPDETLETILALSVPELGDWATVYLLEGRDHLHLAGARGQSNELTTTLSVLASEFSPRIGDPFGPGHVVVTGERQLIPLVTEQIWSSVVYGDNGPVQLQGVTPASTVSLPLRTESGHTLGVLTVARLHGRPFTPGECDFLETLCRRAASALEAAFLFAEERDMAWSLQHRLLPKALPEIPGLAAHAIYRPARAHAEIGGDWYDVIDLGHRRVGICVGDVMGHDPDAAAAMGQLRTALRAYAKEGHLPSTVVNHLCTLCTDLEIDLVTLSYSELNLDDGVLITVNAGHLPPAVVERDAARLLDVATDPALGAVASWEYAETVSILPPGAVLVAYTDGLIESRQEPIDVGLSRLVARLPSPQATPQTLVEKMLEALEPSIAGFDDIVVCAVQPHHRGPLTQARRLVRENPSAVRSVRHWARAVFGHWGLSPLRIHDGELTLTELVTNALTYATGPVAVTLECFADELTIAVQDTSSRPPRRQGADALADYGRGLDIVESLGTGVVTRLEPGGGKTVTARLTRD